MWDMAQIALFEGPQLLRQNKRFGDEVKGGTACGGWVTILLRVPVRVAMKVPLRVIYEAVRVIVAFSFIEV